MYKNPDFCHVNKEPHNGRIRLFSGGIYLGVEGKCSG